MITLGYRNRLMSIFLAAGAIITGVIFLAAPDSALALVVKVMASFLVASGIVSFVFGCITRANGGMVLMVVNSVVDVLLGTLMFLWAPVLSRFIMVVLGALLVAFSVRSLLALLAARKFVNVGLWTIILPVLSFIGGLFLIVNPFSDSIMGVTCGAMLLVYGISELVSAFKVKKAINEYDIKMTDVRKDDMKAKENEFSSAIDVECEKVEEKDQR